MRIDWEKEYNKLRIIHSHLKDIMKERVGGIPHFAGKPKDLPKDYYKSLEKINNSLYRAEEIINKYLGY